MNQPAKNEPFIPETSINKKLGGLKFAQLFDTTALEKAEKIVSKSEDLFKDATLEDFEELKSYFKELDLQNLTKESYSQISTLAFSIKSRAATGGLELATEIANSMYKFCDAAAKTLPKQGHRALELHFNALNEVMEGKFPSKDKAKCVKLVSGLEEIAKRFAS